MLSHKLDLICLREDSPLMEVLQKQNNSAKNGLPGGIALVVDNDDKLLGTITDGDVRRAFLKHQRFDLSAKDVMRDSPIYFDENLSYQDILDRLPEELAKKNINSTKFLSKIILVDAEKR